MSEPTQPDIKKIDFSEFHPLDHYLWECKGYPGGKYRHLKFRWVYAWEDRLRELTLCKLGWHERVRWRGREGSTGFSCRSCMRDMT